MGKASIGVLLIMGFILIMASLMWVGGLDQAFNDINTSMTDNSSGTAHAAVNSGRIFTNGYGMFIVVFGILALVGAIILAVVGMTKSVRRGGR